MDDIDLFAGGMVENLVPGGLAGPTFACIIARQFRNNKIGDRFWFERPDPITGFTVGEDELARVGVFNLPQEILFLEPTELQLSVL